MSDLPAAQSNALEAWANQAIDAGWLPKSAINTLHATTTAAPAQLFTAGDRPLVVGLFGGTGVGKSTLLNRLAGESIALASAERPTSRGITVYVHRSQTVDRLPVDFPMDRMRTALHNNEQYRNVLFIDMPDFDSVESANRDLVNLWLPHLDVVIYVVSPERYRDDQGWRLLLQHAQEHAWLFVMNHWDRGVPAQLKDFREQLGNAGMQNPQLFRSDSSSTGPVAKDDDFEALCSTLQSLADQSIIQSLNDLGILARLKSLKAASDPWLEFLGDDKLIERLQQDWQTHWKKSATNLQDSLTHKVQQLAQLYATQESSWLSRLRGHSDTPVEGNAIPLVDESLLIRLDNLLTDFLNQQAHKSTLPLSALKQVVNEPYSRARRDFADTVNDALHRSLNSPGSAWQRRLHKTLKTSSLVLPLAAMAWIAWRAVSGFAAGGNDSSAYLGTNFAVNGALLLGLAWGIPAFAQKKFRPSREEAARRGMLQGMESAMVQTEMAISEGFNRLGEQASILRAEYHELWNTLKPVDFSALPEAVRRMLATEVNGQTQRSLDVRANTHNCTDKAPAS